MVVFVRNSRKKNAHEHKYLLASDQSGEVAVSQPGARGHRFLRYLRNPRNIIFPGYSTWKIGDG